jgi:hypothetical protein
VFSRDDGTPWPPDYVSRRFKAIAKDAGVRVIKLHEGGRHTGASLARDAEVDPEIRRETLRHADAAMTSHYTHIEAQAHRAAAEAVAKLVRGLDHERLFPVCSPRHSQPLHRLVCREAKVRICAGQRRAWDSNPRYRSPGTAVFKTAAIGH